MAVCKVGLNTIRAGERRAAPAIPKWVLAAARTRAVVAHAGTEKTMLQQLAEHRQQRGSHLEGHIAGGCPDG